MSAAPQHEFQSIQIAPLTPSIGAEISGVRICGDVSDTQVAEIRQALLDWKVVFFRDQDVSVEEHIAFGARFGELEIHPFTPNMKDHPEVLVIHKDENAKFGENHWHSDVTWRQEPSLGSILRARIVPPVGGDTLFSDQVAAYEALDDATKERIDGLTAVHSFVQTFGRGMDDAQKEKFLEEFPEPRHPVVRTHPETGKKGLYVNRAFTKHIEGMEPEESKQLLQFLYRRATIPEYQCRFRWQVDSVAFWDNRAVQHYAAFDYFPAQRRVERVTIIGDKPV
jgi:taurine dioxygenase